MVATAPCAKLKIPEVLYVSTRPTPASPKIEPEAIPMMMYGSRSFTGYHFRLSCGEDSREGEVRSPGPSGVLGSVAGEYRGLAALARRKEEKVGRGGWFAVRHCAAGPHP